MSWNYRVVQYRDGSGFGLHEVYYDKAGEPWGMTVVAARFVGDSADEVREALLRAHKNAQGQPVLVEPTEWPGNKT